MGACQALTARGAIAHSAAPGRGVPYAGAGGDYGALKDGPARAAPTAARRSAPKPRDLANSLFGPPYLHE